MSPIAPKAASEDIDWLVGEEKPLQVLSNTDVNKAFDDILLNVFEEYQKPVEELGKEKPLQDKKQQHKYLSKKKKEKAKR
jgi:hypothetical protein